MCTIYIYSHSIFDLYITVINFLNYCVSVCVSLVTSNFSTILQISFQTQMLFLLKINNPYSYSQTCIKRSPLGQGKSGLLLKTGELLKRGSNRMKFSMTGQEKGDLLMQMKFSIT